MLISEELQQTLNSIIEHRSLALDAAAAVGLLWGVFLWLFGARVVRASTAMVGIIGGAAVGGIVAHSLKLEPLLAYALGGGVAGGLVVWFTYRLWIGLLLAIVLGVMVPLGVLAWSGTPAPDTDDTLTEARQITTDQAMRLVQTEDESDEQALSEQVREALDGLGEALRAWWDDEVGAGAKTGVILGGLVAAGTGLLVGLVFPKIACAIVAAAVGAAFVLTGLNLLAARYAPALADVLPAGPRGVVVMIAAATVVGAIIQWTILRPKADE